MYVARQHAIEPERALELAAEIGVGQLVTVGQGAGADARQGMRGGTGADLAEPGVEALANPAALSAGVPPVVVPKINATYLPFNVATRGGRRVLQAHMNRVNPQWRDSGEALVIVQGPQAMISALDFPPERPGAAMPTVPTWNYVTIHLRGRFSVHDDADWKLAHLEALVAGHETKWRMATHSDPALIEKALAVMVGVEVELTEVEGKAKLSQNLSSADIEYTAGRLRERDPEAGPVADLMERVAVPWAKAREERVERVHGERGSDAQ